MRKTFIFINAVRCTVLYLILGFLYIPLIVFCVMGTDGYSTFICMAVFGGFLMLLIVGFLISFELIFFNRDRIVSIKAFRRIQIFYTEISNINATKKEMGTEIIEDVWEIQTDSEKTIYLIRSKKRDKIMEEIKNSIKE